MTNGYVKSAEVEAILSGGQPSVNKFVVESVISLKEGQEKQHDLLEDFGRQGTNREKRIVVVERWQKDWEKSCPDRMKQAIMAASGEADQRHEVLHAAHMKGFHEAEVKREGDANGENHSSDRKVDAVIAPLEKKVWVMWGIFLYVAIEGGHALIMWLVERAASN